jgi:type VI secretion system protein ImpM
MAPEASSEQAPPGWFGKLSMLGDFAHRRLPVEVVQACDTWLARCVARSRQELNSAWLDSYLTAPVWCFAWAPRVVDGSWWFGALMPSVDAVGRYFPLLVARPGLTAPCGAQELQQLATWYSDIGRCAVSTLQPSATLAQFEADLAAVMHPSLDVHAGSQAPPPHEAGDGTRHLRVDDGETWPASAASVALRSVLPALHGHTLWWPLADTEIKPAQVSVVSALPAAEQFARMLQGQL